MAVTDAGKLGNDDAGAVVGLAMFEGVIMVHPIVFGITNFSGSTTLLGMRSYIKLPSGAFGGLGNDIFSGFGNKSRGVNLSHSQPVVEGLPSRFAMSVTLPRSFFLHFSIFLISAILMLAT